VQELVAIGLLEAEGGLEKTKITWGGLELQGVSGIHRALNYVGKVVEDWGGIPVGAKNQGEKNLSLRLA